MREPQRSKSSGVDWSNSKWGGLGLGGVESRCLIEEPGEEIALRRPAAGERGGGW